jgi:hypothetical protein
MKTVTKKRYEIGQRVGKLVIISIGQSTRHGRAVIVKCDCGSPPKVILGPNLGEHKTISCGCTRASACAVRSRIHGLNRATGYESWRGLKARIKRGSHRKYRAYGGRGLDMDPRWENFETFLADVGSPPTPEHSIERRDNDRGYWPDNCYWATVLEQGRNKRNNVLIDCAGGRLILAEACRRAGILAGTVSSRVGRYGETHQQAFEHLLRL